MVCYFFAKINRFPSLDFLGVFRVREKAFNFIFSTFSPQNVKIAVTVPFHYYTTVIIIILHYSLSVLFASLALNDIKMNSTRVEK